MRVVYTAAALKDLEDIAMYLAANHPHPALFLYVKSDRHRKLNTVSRGWCGFRVIIEVTGTMRPLARKRA